MNIRQVNIWVNEYVNTNELMHRGVNEYMNELLNACIQEWMNERMSQQMGEWMPSLFPSGPPHPLECAGDQKT